MLFRFLIIFFSIAISLTVQGQEALSEMEKEYNPISANVLEQLDLAPKYAKALFLQNQKAKSYQVLAHAISVAVKQQDGKYATVLYAIQAMHYRLDKKEEEVLQSLVLAQKHSLQTTSNEAKGYLQYAEGWLLIRKDKMPEAIQAYLKAIELYEHAPITSTLYGRFATVVKELAIIYANLREYQLEEKYSNQFLVLASKQKDPNLLFDAYMRMGYVYEQKYNLDPSNVEIRNRVEQYYLQAIATFTKHKEAIYIQSNLSYAAINLANLYLSFDIDKAKQYAELAKKVSIETGEAIHIASSLGILAELAVQEHKYDLAKSYFLEASEEIAKSTLQDHNVELSILESLSEISEKQGDYLEALHYHKAYFNKYQNRYDQEKLEIAKRLESQFESERNEQKYSKLQLESDQKAQQIRLMDILQAQREQVYNNLKLAEENQRERLKFSELEAEKTAQQLLLAALETEQKNADIKNFKKLVAYKEKINTYYVVFIVVFSILILLLLYAYKQRVNSLKQIDALHTLALEKEKQNSKISTLTALLQGQEQERGRLARDLHDGLGGLLSATKLQLSGLDTDQANTLKEGIGQSINQIDGAVEELRRIAHNLMPDLLSKYGLTTAIAEFAARMSHSGLDIHTAFINYSNTLEQQKELLVYRIIQELINNAIKHANASEIIIQISEHQQILNLLVEDNGRGFDIKKLETNKSAGFHNIESRIQFLKGSMNLHSEVNVGTSIELQIPLV